MPESFTHRFLWSASHCSIVHGHMPAYFVHTSRFGFARIASPSAQAKFEPMVSPHPKPLYTFYALDTRTRPLPLLARSSAFPFLSPSHCFA